jgi:hypothetical protein
LTKNEEGITSEKLFRCELVIRIEFPCFLVLIQIVPFFVDDLIELSLFNKVVPHITNEIQEWIERVAMNPVDGTDKPADVCVIELGGTIGKNYLLHHCSEPWNLLRTLWA